MINKSLQKMKNFFRQLPLYWKNLMITSITLIMTLIIFFLIFSLFATKFLEANQKSKFNKTVNEIVAEVEKNGIDDEKLGQYMIEGYTIFITHNNQLIYPAYSSALSLTVSGTAEPADTVEGSMATVVSSFENGNASLSARKTVLYHSNTLILEVYYPVIVNPSDIKTILINIIPYFTLIGLLVSLGISWIYSRYFTSKINHLNELVHQMSSSSISSEFEPQSGDELQELKNNVYSMYQELQETLEQLSEEMEVVKRLEEDRQLFMRGATHELKTPIMAMMTTLRGLMEGVEGYENQEHHLTICYGRLQSMSRLVNEMLEISRLESVVFAGETNINQVSMAILDVYDYMIQDKELKIAAEFKEPLKLKIPERNLQKIVSNLIGNSVKYSPPKSTVTILSSKNSWEIRNKIKYTENLNFEAIFDPFISYEQEDESAEMSHGLGLYVVSAILKQYGYTYDCFLDNQSKEFVFKIKII